MNNSIVLAFTEYNSQMLAVWAGKHTWSHDLANLEHNQWKQRDGDGYQRFDSVTLKKRLKRDLRILWDFKSWLVALYKEGEDYKWYLKV